MKVEFRIKILTCPVENTDAVCESYVASGFNRQRNTAHVDFKYKSLDNFVLSKKLVYQLSESN